MILDLTKSTSSEVLFLLDKIKLTLHTDPKSRCAESTPAKDLSDFYSAAADIFAGYKCILTVITS